MVINRSASVQGGYRRDLVVQAEQDCGTWPLARSRRAKARQGQPCCSQRSAHGRDHRHFSPAGHTAAQAREAEEENLIASGRTRHRLIAASVYGLGGRASVGTSNATTRSLDTAAPTRVRGRALQHTLYRPSSNRLDRAQAVSRRRLIRPGTDRLTGARVPRRRSARQASVTCLDRN